MINNADNALNACKQMITIFIFLQKYYLRIVRMSLFELDIQWKNLPYTVYSCIHSGCLY